MSVDISSLAAHKINFEAITFVDNHKSRGFHKDNSIITKHVFKVQVVKGCTQDHANMVAFNSQLIQDKQKFWDVGKRLWHELDKN